MDASNIIRVLLAGISLLSGVTFIIWAIARKSNRVRNFGIAGLCFLAMYLINISIVKFQNIAYKPTNKIWQLKFLAFGKSSNGDKGWIGLYEDSTWEFGKSYREVKTNGTYKLKGDTIILTSTKQNSEYFENAILISNNQETNSSELNLDGLRIELDKLNKSVKHEL